MAYWHFLLIVLYTSRASPFNVFCTECMHTTGILYEICSNCAVSENLIQIMLTRKAHEANLQVPIRVSNLYRKLGWGGGVHQNQLFLTFTHMGCVSYCSLRCVQNVCFQAEYTAGAVGVQCPDHIAKRDSFVCEITLSRGTAPTVSVDFDDGRSLNARTPGQ